MDDLRSTNEFTVLDSAAAGMQAQRTALDLAARNIAAAQASQPGHPYERLVMEASTDLEAGSVDDERDDVDNVGDGTADFAPALTVRREPGTGDSLTEMIAALDAQRAYEQHASIFDIGKRLAERTIDIGRS